MTEGVGGPCRQRVPHPAHVAHGDPVAQPVAPHQRVLVYHAVDVALAQRLNRAWAARQARAVAIVPDVLLAHCGDEERRREEASVSTTLLARYGGRARGGGREASWRKGASVSAGDRCECETNNFVCLD